MKYLTLAAAFALAAPSMATAQDRGFTMSEGYSHYQFDEFDVHAAGSRLSYALGDYFSIDAQSDTGLSGSHAIACPTGTDCTGLEPRARFRYSFGVGIAGHLPINERFDVFMRAGYSAVNFKASVGPSGNDTSITYGVGANYFFNDAHGMRLEYNRASYDDFGDASTWGISYVRRF